MSPLYAKCIKDRADVRRSAHKILLHRSYTLSSKIFATVVDGIGGRPHKSKYRSPDHDSYQTVDLVHPTTPVGLPAELQKRSSDHLRSHFSLTSGILGYKELGYLIDELPSALADGWR